MTTYAKRKLKYSRKENFNLPQYVEWDRFVILAGSKNGLWVTLLYLGFLVRTVTIPCTLNLSINLERGISESSREANF